MEHVADTILKGLTKEQRSAVASPKRRILVVAGAGSGKTEIMARRVAWWARVDGASPAAVWATLLDEGRYLCSERTMYRLLAGNGELRERRDQLTHPAYARPELLAARPNEVWSWDITKLKGPATWTYYYLYVVLDVFSRYVVAWSLQMRESGELAKDLIGQALTQQKVERDTLTVHADRGSSMTSKPVAFLLADLGVAKTHNRPHTAAMVELLLFGWRLA